MTKNIIGLMLLMSSLTFTETRAQGNNDFKIDVKVTQGIEDAGYLVQVFDRNQSARTSALHLRPIWTNHSLVTSQPSFLMARSARPASVSPSYQARNVTSK